VVPLFASLQLPSWLQVAPVLAETPLPLASSLRLDQRPFATMTPAFSQIGYIEVPKSEPFRLILRNSSPTGPSDNAVQKFWNQRPCPMHGAVLAR